MSRSDVGAEVDYRYSDKPRVHYIKTSRKVDSGTASSTLRDTVQVWNLAYLSFDFESENTHPDPYFTVHVRRSVQTRISDGKQDLVEPPPYCGLVGSLLLLPAPRFVYIIKSRGLFKNMPLYAFYGKAWLDIIEKRSWLCQCDRNNEEPVVDCSLAVAALSRY